jgi:hypothetical protein
MGPWVSPNRPPVLVAGSKARVGGVVVTHFIGRERGDPAHFEYLRQIAAHYRGPVVIANDLDVF